MPDTGDVPPPIHVSEDVATALAEGRPVAALESTIIAHGLPRPRNHAVAVESQQILRDQGVVPATIAVGDGEAKVGLSDAELESLATDDGVAKAGLRDLPVVLERRRRAATTVASTAWLAHRAGIEVFATGGLGGVHREPTDHLDESADLGVLGRVPIAVVSAGVKSVLDVPATLERLETLGVTVVGFRTRRFPGFYVTDSGHELDWQVDDADQAAALLDRVAALGLTGAVLVANPVDPGHQLDPELHERALAASLAAAADAGVAGKEVTPFLLDELVQATDGRSLEANIHAVRGNVRLAGAIATAVARRRDGR